MRIAETVLIAVDWVILVNVAKHINYLISI